MTKRLCDICGTEIINNKDRYNISIDNPFVRGKYITVIPDICPYCACSIYHHIEGLKKSLDKSRRNNNA